MRILAVGNVYPPHSLGGYETIWRGTMRELRDRGHQTRVLTTDYRAPNVDRSTEEDPNVYRELRWYWEDHQWPAIGKLERLTLERHNAKVFDRHLHELQPDVVTWWPMGGMSLSLIERVRRRGLPSLLFILDYWPTYGPERDLWSRSWRSRPASARLIERLTGIPARYDLPHAGRWLFCSSCVHEQTVSSGIDAPDWEIFPPGIEEWYLTAPSMPLQQEWRWRLLYVGRVVGQKGVHTAIEALNLLPAQSTLRIIGEGDELYRRQLEDVARQFGVEERVRFDPSMYGTSLISAYQDADVLLFPVAWPEPWGLVPLEAMAVGTPVVATGQGGSGEYLVDEQNSLLFEARNPDGLAAAVVRLAEDPRLRQKLRLNGMETAHQHTERDFNRRAVEEIEARARNVAR